jgi:hypothetical protein
MNDRTRLIGLKVKRAKHHIADLEGRINTFFTGEPDPYPIVKRHDSGTGDLVYKLGECSPIPEDFALIIGDILQNLRTALDHLVWQLILSNGGTPNNRSGFPIAKTIKEYEAESPKRVEGMAPDAIKMIRDLNPYCGGNEDLFGLHILNNADKHRILLVVGAAHIATSIKFPLSLTPKEFRIALPAPFDRSYPLKDGTELYRILKEDISNFVQDPQFRFQIAFGDAEVMNGEPLLPPLHKLADLVDRIILSFDKFLT